MGEGNAVRVLEAEQLEGLEEEAHDDGAHEEGAGAANETGDRHDLDRVAGEEVRGAWPGEREERGRREEGGGGEGERRVMDSEKHKATHARTYSCI